MPQDNSDYYILFPNHMEGLRLHTALKEAGVKSTIVPTPRHISLNCGMALRLTAGQVERAKEIIAAIGAVTNGVVAAGQPD